MSEKGIVREINALTVMPLPVKILSSWYDLLPKILPLLRWSSGQASFYVGEELINIFLERWRKILIRREGAFVWLHLGGVACHEVMPNFIKEIRYRIDCTDGEITEKGGMKGLIQHWRTCIEELKSLDDEAVLQARNETLCLLQPETWHQELGREWSFAAERAHKNFGRIRPVIKKWIAKHENLCNLDEPFGGRLSAGGHPVLGTGIVWQ